MSRTWHLLRKCWLFGLAVAHFCGRRGVAAAGLVALGAAVEGFGVLLLVPLLTILFDTGNSAGGLTASVVQTWLPPDRGPLLRLSILLAVFGLLMVVRAIVLWRRDSILGQLQTAFVADQRVTLARRLGAARWPTLARLGHGRVTHLMGGDIQSIGAGVHFLFQGGVAVVMLAGQAVVAALLSPALALISIGMMLVGALLLSTVIRRSSDVGRLMIHANLALMTSVGQFLGGIKVAMSQNIQHHFVERFERELAIAANQQAGFIGQQALLRAFWTLLGAAIGAVTVFAGYALLHLSPAVLIAILVILARMSGPASQIQLAIQQIAYSLAAWDEVRDMDRHLLEAEGPPAKSGVGTEWPDGPIRMERVTFRHPGGGEAADRSGGIVDFSLAIEPGEFIGLEGRSGAGKTTLADLLCGLLVPQAGRISIANVPLTGENAARWQERIAYVAQDPVLFNESVRDNLLWANPRDESALSAALAMAGAHDLVERLPQGLDTVVGEKGSLISGGERQRLALARALLREPALLILDEATNAIDLAGEAEILARLRNARMRTAILIIAHRRESFQYCDRVIRLGEDDRGVLP